MTEINKNENPDFQNALRNNSDSKFEPYVLTQEQVDEQLKSYTAPLASSYKTWLDWFKEWFSLICRCSPNG